MHIKKSVVARASKAAPRRKTRVPATGDRNLRIAEASYLRAEKRGFSGGDPVQDWLDAEKEIDLSE